MNDRQHPENTQRSRAAALGWVVLAYVVAMGAGGLAFVLWPGHTLERSAAASIAATLSVWLFSTAFRNSSFYDAYWSVAPMVLVVHWWWLPDSAGGLPTRQLLVVLLVWAWGLRLTHNWLRGWQGLQHEDWRYVDLRSKSGKAFPAVDLLGIHMFPTVQTFTGCLPAYLALTSAAPLGPLDAVGAAVMSAAVVIQLSADNALRRFVLSDREPGAILQTGLWAHSRHPNYFGEILFWWGLALFALGSEPRWWALAGAVSITLMFVGVSVPMLDRRSLERRPGYAQHAEKVSSIVPWARKG